MSIKITTGKKKGITIASTKSAKELRPTQSIVREALVDILHNIDEDFAIEGSAVLDLYAGIGTVGLEFLSNDAVSVTFVEKNPYCAKALKENLRKLSFVKESVVLVKPVVQVLKKFSSSTQFDLIFADAPYKSREFEDVLKVILQRNLLREGGIFIWECSDSQLETLVNKAFPGQVNLIKIKKYGDSFLYFFQITK